MTKTCVTLTRPVSTVPTNKVFYLDGKWGNLGVASEKIGYPFSENVSATIDNFRNLGCPCEIVIKNHLDASGKLWRAIRDGDINSDQCIVTLR